jgi:hypothetical protein
MSVAERCPCCGQIGVVTRRPSWAFTERSPGPAAEPVAWEGPFPEGDAWIGVDLDGTLARYDGWVSEVHIGEPIPAMVELVRGWLAEGRNVAIFTARASVPNQRARAIPAIEAWCQRHFGVVLPITCRKDYGMVACFDDRATQVVPNDGRPFCHPGPPSAEPATGRDRSQGVTKQEVPSAGGEPRYTLKRYTDPADVRSLEVFSNRVQIILVLGVEEWEIEAVEELVRLANVGGLRSRGATTETGNEP